MSPITVSLLSEGQLRAKLASIDPESKYPFGC